MGGITRQQRRFVARKGERAVGFTAVPNARIAGRHAAEVLRLAALGVSPMEAEQQAWRNVAATLPAPRMTPRNYRKPSKTASPAYRKSIWPSAKIEERR